jgi:glutaminyl-peptide cyclotransferase
MAKPPILFQNSTDFSSKNISNIMDWFTEEPHPMGSVRQKIIGSEIETILVQNGFKTEKQEFQSTIQKAKDYNIIGTRSGKSDCSLIFSGHYDTKFFSKFRFVGANDGGSQTAFLLELSRVISESHFKKNSLGSCSISLIFFDGEESFLPNWEDGNRIFHVKDNTYGSRDFVAKNIEKKGNHFFYHHNPIQVVFVVDMIGHKKQDLFITKGSDDFYANKFLAGAKEIKISKSEVMIEDDHGPFLELGVPVLHIIDWTNLKEWHTEKDTPNIISYGNIKNFGDSVFRFLSQDIKGN